MTKRKAQRRDHMKDAPTLSHPDENTAGKFGKSTFKFIGMGSPEPRYTLKYGQWIKSNPSTESSINPNWTPPVYTSGV